MQHVRKCSNGHYEDIPSYHLIDFRNYLRNPRANFCRRDGSKIEFTEITDEEFHKVYEKAPLNTFVATDWYELYCDNGHYNEAVGYSNDVSFRFCEVCGKHITRSVPHYGYITSSETA